MAETLTPGPTADQGEGPYPFADLDEVRRWDLVRAAVHDDQAELTSWHVTELYGFGHGSHIYRASGTARTNHETTPWSLVVKAFVAGGGGPAQASVDPAAWDFWKREWLAYQAPWLSRLDGGLVGPTVLGVGDSGDRGAWVAMEDLSTLDRRPWTLEHFRTAAQHLGAFQAPYLLGEPLPAEEWLCADRVRSWTEQSAAVIDLLPGVQDDPLAAQILPPSTVTRLLELWQNRGRVYEALASLPATLCHGDYYPRNLFFRRTGHGDQSIAIDWASCGRGVIGEDLNELVDISLVWFEADPAAAAELESHCLEGYLTGLRSAGWNGNPEEVLLGYLAADVLSTSLGGLTPTLMTIKDATGHAGVERVFGRSMSDVVSNLSAIYARQEGQLTRLWQLLGRS